MQHCNVYIEFSGVPLLKAGLHVKVKGKKCQKIYFKKAILKNVKYRKLLL